MQGTNKRGMMLFLVLLTSWMCAAATELLKNGDFESSIEGWTCTCSFSSTTESHSGNNALHTSYRDKKTRGPAQYLPLHQFQPGKQYLFTAYVKLRKYIETTEPQELKVTLMYMFRDHSDTGYQTFITMDDVPMEKWFKVEGQFTLKEYNKTLENLVLYIEGPVPGIDIFLDDASLTFAGVTTTVTPTTTTTSTVKTTTTVPTTSISSSTTLTSTTTGSSTSKPLTANEKRIESIRKGNLTVTISSDRALSDVEVEFEQLRHEFGFGSAVDGSLLATNAAYRQWYLDNFEWAVLKNSMEWRQVEQTRGQPNWESADRAMWILETNGKKLRGHAIFSSPGDEIPDWVQSIGDRVELFMTCMKRVKEAALRYEGRLKHWDVNNEMMAGNFFENKYGSSSIRYDMFKKARQVDPNVKLFLNDYNVISGGSRLMQYIDMVNEFRVAGAPLGGIGVQGHFSGHPQISTVKDRLDQLAKLNLPIWVTELDYVHPNDQERADVLEQLLTTFFSHPSVEGVLFSGFDGQRHWRGSDASLTDGINMAPNAAGRMWQRLFHQQWRTNVVNKVGNIKQGKRESTWVKAFYGDYKVSVSVGGKVVTSRDVNIRKEKGSEHLNIQLNSDGVIG